MNIDSVQTLPVIMAGTKQFQILQQFYSWKQILKIWKSAFLKMSF